MVKLTIDGKVLEVEDGLTIMEAARRAGIEIPALCYHPDLGPLPRSQAKPENLIYQGSVVIKNEVENPDFESIRCRLCLVEVEGVGLVTSCDTKVEDGMVVHTNTPKVQEERRNNLLRILERYNHPVVCLTCDRDKMCPPYSVCIRSAAFPKKCVTCPAYDDCELRKVASLIGIKSVTIYHKVLDFSSIVVSKNGRSVFEFDPSLCVGCLRCVRLCSELKGNRVIGFVVSEGKVHVGVRGRSFKESGCKGCAACAKVCPTGALVIKPRR